MMLSLGQTSYLEIIIGNSMFLAFMAEMSKNAGLLQVTGMEIGYLTSLRWVHEAY